MINIFRHWNFGFFNRIYILWAVSGICALGLSDEKTHAAYKQSFSYEKSKDFAKAIKSLGVVYKSHSRDYTLNMRLGWLYYSAGKYDGALKYYAVATKVSPSSIEAKLGYTLPLLAMGKYKVVEDVAKKIVRADEYNYYGNYRLAFVFRMQKKYQAAKKIIGKMLKIYPSDQSFLLEYVLGSLAQGEFNLSRKVLTHMLEVNPDHPTANELITQVKKSRE